MYVVDFFSPTHTHFTVATTPDFYESSRLSVQANTTHIRTFVICMHPTIRMCSLV